ncbi:MAG: hypothetical protein IJ699_04365 [Bacteroidaceae bacterium]|nr:hypothetical protein [Bacteroidaceae bacterium]
MKQSTHLVGILLLGLILLLNSTNSLADESSGSKPQWVRKGEASLNARRTNNTYYFKVIQNIGPDVHQLRRANTNALADFIGKRNQVEGMEMTEMSNTSGTAGVSTSEQYNMVFKNRFSTDVFYASLVDEYWESVAGGYQYYALYAVSADGSTKPTFDRFEVSRSYGALPAVMSVIPGVGQLYKGQKLKGSLMLGGAVVCVGGIILCENRRSYYQTRIIEQPKFARDWNQKSDNWTTGRNIAIGATAALVVWSVIDAAVAPGTTRIRVTPTTSLALRPAALATPDGVGLGAALAINF